MIQNASMPCLKSPIVKKVVGLKKPIEIPPKKEVKTKRNFDSFVIPSSRNILDMSTNSHFNRKIPSF
jgi:hypothetical protein